MNAIVLSTTALFLAVLAMAAPMLLGSGHTLSGWAVTQFFHFACHQEAGRSLWFLGGPVAVCARCLGIYLGAALGAWYSASRRVTLRLLAAAMVVNSADIFAEAFGAHGNWPGARLIFGALLGASAAMWLASYHRHTEAERSTGE